MVTERNSGSFTNSIRTFFSNYLTGFGTTITLRKITKIYDNMDREIGFTTTESTIKADVQFVTKKDLQLLNLGIVEIGDGLLFVEHDADISLKDEIVINSVKWRIVTQIEGELIGGELVFLGYLIRKSEYFDTQSP